MNNGNFSELMRKMERRAKKFSKKCSTSLPKSELTSELCPPLMTTLEEVLKLKLPHHRNRCISSEQEI